MNVERLEEIVGVLEVEPLRLNMDSWGYTVPPGSEDSPFFFSADAKYSRGDYPPCGTIGCIAGWAVFLHSANTLETMKTRAKYRNRHVALTEILRVPEEAQQLLDLTDSQATHLFYTELWPSEFRRSYVDAPTPEARVEAVVARIRHMIETGL